MRWWALSKGWRTWGISERVITCIRENSYFFYCLEQIVPSQGQADFSFIKRELFLAKISAMQWAALTNIKYSCHHIVGGSWSGHLLKRLHRKSVFYVGSWSNWSLWQLYVSTKFNWSSCEYSLYWLLSYWVPFLGCLPNSELF